MFFLDLWIGGKEEDNERGKWNGSKGRDVLFYFFEGSEIVL